MIIQITSYYSIFVASIQLSFKTVDISFMFFQLDTLDTYFDIGNHFTSFSEIVVRFCINLVCVFLTCVCFSIPCRMYCNKHILSCVNFEYACLKSHFETVCCTVYILTIHQFELLCTFRMCLCKCHLLSKVFEQNLQYIRITVYISNVAL